MHKIVIGKQVLERLDAMLGTTGYEHLGKLGTFLLDELTRAEVIDDKELPSQIVSMHRKVRFRDVDTDRETEATLVYPDEVGKIEAGFQCSHQLAPPYSVSRRGRPSNMRRRGGDTSRSPL
jgi:hypothetical protein